MCAAACKRICVGSHRACERRNTHAGDSGASNPTFTCAGAARPECTNSSITLAGAAEPEQWVLRDSSGSVYKLDDSSRAQAFEGKTVKVTGRLDADSKMIHVDSIQALAS